MADMAYAMLNIGAWGDVERVALELIEHAADITPRAYASIRRLAIAVAHATDAPTTVRDILHTLVLAIHRAT
ncbi:hypothetical protein [Frankia sp. AiPa1]|uniref:hypothetical protein n=1 Tax=Frankia sp. AiPa1 TaxID=573492 RepID=UPI00202B62B1|nr:hypothetical protein [Frankia sp. AiPa1]MCL9760096.1 hypothetical protein [Frankia sp. AiPa1]